MIWTNWLCKPKQIENKVESNLKQEPENKERAEIQGVPINIIKNRIGDRLEISEVLPVGFVGLSGSDFYGRRFDSMLKGFKEIREKYPNEKISVSYNFDTDNLIMERRANRLEYDGEYFNRYLKSFDNHFKIWG